MASGLFLSALDFKKIGGIHQHDEPGAALLRFSQGCGFRFHILVVYLEVMKLQGMRGTASPLARAVQIGVFVLSLGALLSLSALAFSSSLQPEEVREAYSLGQTTNREELADFLKQYTHDFPYPSDHPDAFAQSVEFQTPYEQIVLRTSRTNGYSKFQADKDYQENSGLVIVRVVVSIRLNYAGPVPPAESFNVVVSQTKPIEPQKMTNTVTCNPFSSTASPVNSDCAPYTREILLSFHAGQFTPGRATVKVMLPFGHSLETKYNLDKLK